MGKSEHTAGPWHISGNGKDLHIGSDQYLTVHCSMNRSNPEVEANARLISAAPDMLEALNAVKEAWNVEGGPFSQEFSDAMLRVRAAIAKATLTRLEASEPDHG